MRSELMSGWLCHAFSVGTGAPDANFSGAAPPFVSRWEEVLIKTQDSDGTSTEILKSGGPNFNLDFAHHHVNDFGKVT